MDAQITRVAELLQEAAETHHVVCRIVDGADDDWASWYADWLVRPSELPQLLGRQPVRSELVYLDLEVSQHQQNFGISPPINQGSLYRLGPDSSSELAPEHGFEP